TCPRGRHPPWCSAPAQPTPGHDQRSSGARARLLHAERSQRGDGQARDARRRSLLLGARWEGGGGRSRDTGGGGQRRRLPADDRELPVAVRSLWREPDTVEIDFGALEFHDVFKIYRSGPAETVALRGLDLRIEQRELVALFGPSGSGKSTALHLAAALDEPSAGEVRVFGRSLSRLGNAERGRYRAHQVAIGFQSANLWPSLTAIENVVVSLRLAARRGARAAATEALAAFGLRDRAHQRAGSLSGGEQQRVAIAAAAARQAPLVLADEPTAELDARAEEAVLRALRRLRDGFGSTIVVVTRSEPVPDPADRRVEIRHGRR